MNNPIFKFGLIGAGLVVIINLATWFMGREVFAFSTPLLGFIIGVVCAVKSTGAVRAYQNNSITFGEAFKSSWFTYFIISLSSSLMFFVVTNLLDPGYNEFMVEKLVEQTEIFEKFMEEDDVDSMLEQIETTDNTSLVNVLSSFLMNFFFWGSIICAIIALSMKREPVDNFL